MLRCRSQLIVIQNAFRCSRCRGRFPKQDLPAHEDSCFVVKKENHAVMVGKTVPRTDSGAWLPDGYSQIFRPYVLGPLVFWTMAPLCYAAKFDPFLSLDCAPTPSSLAQSKERKGSNFAI